MARKAKSKGLKKHTEAEWAAIRDLYVIGEVDEDRKHQSPSYPEIASKFGVHKTTVATRGAKEGWVRLREEHEKGVSDGRTEVATRVLGNEAGQFDVECFGSSRALMAQAAKHITDHTGYDENGEAKDPLPIDDIKDLSSAIKTLQHVGRLALGKSTDNKAINASLDLEPSDGDGRPVPIINDPNVIAEAAKILERTIGIVNAGESSDATVLPPKPDPVSTSVP